MSGEGFYQTQDDVRAHYDSTEFGGTYNAACADMIDAQAGECDVLAGLGCGNSEAEWLVLHKRDFRPAYIGADNSAAMRRETERRFAGHACFKGVLNLDMFAPASWRRMRAVAGPGAHVVWTVLGGTFGNGRAADLLHCLADEPEGTVMFADANVAEGVDEEVFRNAMRAELRDSAPFFQAPLLRAGHEAERIETRLVFSTDDLGIRCTFLSEVRQGRQPAAKAEFVICRFDLDALARSMKQLNLELTRVTQVPGVRPGVSLLHLQKGRGGRS